MSMKIFYRRFNFYTSTISSVLTFGMTCWGGKRTHPNKNRLDKNIKKADCVLVHTTTCYHQNPKIAMSALCCKILMSWRPLRRLPGRLAIALTDSHQVACWNATAKAVVRQRKRDRITPTLRELHWLRVHDRIPLYIIKLLSVTYRSVHENLPFYHAELIPPYYALHLVLFDRRVDHFLRACVLLVLLRCAGMKLSASFPPTPCVATMSILAWKFLCAI